MLIQAHLAMACKVCFIFVRYLVLFDWYCRLDFCRCLVGDLQGMFVRHVQIKSRRLSLYAIGDELNAVVLCELAILFALVCSIGIDRLHVIASNILRGISNLALAC